MSVTTALGNTDFKEVSKAKSTGLLCAIPGNMPAVKSASSPSNRKAPARSVSLAVTTRSISEYKRAELQAVAVGVISTNPAGAGEWRYDANKPTTYCWCCDWPLKLSRSRSMTVRR